MHYFYISSEALEPKLSYFCPRTNYTAVRWFTEALIEKEGAAAEVIDAACVCLRHSAVTARGQTSQWKTNQAATKPSHAAEVVPSGAYRGGPGAALASPRPRTGVGTDLTRAAKLSLHNDSICT